MKSRYLTAVLLALVAGWTPRAALGASDDPLEALVTWSDATVTADAATGPRVLRPGDRLGEGERIYLPDKTTASLLCSTDRQVDLIGQASWHLTSQACADGQALDAGMFRRLTPYAGHYTTSQGTPTRRQGVRSGGNEAIMLSPRHGAVDVPRPRLVWRALHDADQLEAEYELRIREHRGSFRLPVRDLTCTPDPRWAGLTVCSTPWPKGVPDLQPGQRNFWQIGFRSTLTARQHLAQNAIPVRRLSVEASAELRQAVEDLDEQPWHPAHRALLEGHLAARFGLVPQALGAYRRAAREGAEAGLDGGALTVTQGDLLLRIGLTYLAEKRYAEALQMASGTPRRPVVQAAASRGLGRCADRRKDHRVAIEHWQRAHDLYGDVGMDDAARRAEIRVQEAAKRLPTGPE